MFSLHLFVVTEQCQSGVLFFLPHIFYIPRCYCFSIWQNVSNLILKKQIIDIKITLLHHTKQLHRRNLNDKRVISFISALAFSFPWRKTHKYAHIKWRGQCGRNFFKKGFTYPLPNHSRIFLMFWWVSVLHTITTSLTCKEGQFIKMTVVKLAQSKVQNAAQKCIRLPTGL